LIGRLRRWRPTSAPYWPPPPLLLQYCLYAIAATYDNYIHRCPLRDVSLLTTSVAAAICRFPIGRLRPCRYLLSPYWLDPPPAATCRLLIGSEAGGEGDALREGEGVEQADSKAAGGEHQKSAVQGVGKPAVARVDDVPDVIDLRLGAYIRSLSGST
jgi:hypothetical protein